MRTPAEIHAPPIPHDLPWVNVASLRMDQQIGRPVLVEFFDVCRVNSLRTLPYVKAWHARYAAAGLRVISVHCPGYEASRDEDGVRAATARLGIEHPVCLDHRFLLWDFYDTPGWPARYLFDQRLVLFDYHHGEGAYGETERAIQELLGVERDVLAPIRPEDDPEALIVVPTAEQAGAYSGPYEAGGVWAVVDGEGTVTANGEDHAVAGPACVALLVHERHTAGVLDLQVGDGVTCHATAFTPGLA